MLRKSLIAAAAISAVFGVQANDLSKSAISEKFQSLTPFKISAVEDAPFENAYQLITDEGIFYITKNGEHIFSGSIHEATDGLPNLTKARVAEESKKELSILKESFVTFGAPNQKHEIVVFYDASCGYCQKLHREVPALNAQGVTVHYAGWPRMGVMSQRDPNSYSAGFKDLESMFCADSPKAAFDRASEGVSAAPASCATKIEEHFSLGKKMGVQGTPAVFNMSGEEVTRGYLPADAIVTNLEKL